MCQTLFILYLINHNVKTYLVSNSKTALKKLNCSHFFMSHTVPKVGPQESTLTWTICYCRTPAHLGGAPARYDETATCQTASGAAWWNCYCVDVWMGKWWLSCDECAPLGTRWISLWRGKRYLTKLRKTIGWKMKAFSESSMLLKRSSRENALMLFFINCKKFISMKQVSVIRTIYV